MPTDLPQGMADARLFAWDAMVFTRERTTAIADNDPATGMLAVFALLATEALFTELVAQPPGDGQPGTRSSPRRRR